MFPSEVWIPILHARSDPQQRQHFIIGPGIDEVKHGSLPLRLQIYRNQGVFFLVLIIFVGCRRVVVQWMKKVGDLEGLVSSRSTTTTTTTGRVKIKAREGGGGYMERKEREGGGGCNCEVVEEAAAAAAAATNWWNWSEGTPSNIFVCVFLSLNFLYPLSLFPPLVSSL